MAKDARLLLNKKKRQSGNFQDARQVITARKIQKKKQHPNVLNRIANAGNNRNPRLNQIQGVVRRGLAVIPVAHRLGNKNVQQQQVNKLRRSLGNNRQQLNNRNPLNSAQNSRPFIRNRFVGNQKMPWKQPNRQNNTLQLYSQKFVRNWIQTDTSLPQQNRGSFQRRNNAQQRNQFYSGQSNNITVTRPNWNKNQQTDERDELEKMTLDDLPGGKQQSYLTLAQKRSMAESRPNPTYARQQQYTQGLMVADTIPLASSSEPGCKVVVSNLHHTVTEHDITELFGDIGLMRNACLVEPGKAIIEYYSEDTAIRACSTYHNVLLDGQPMQCVVQRLQDVGRKSITSRLGDKFGANSRLSYQHQSQTPIIVDEVLYHDPKDGSGREVSFIVKLP